MVRHFRAATLEVKRQIAREGAVCAQRKPVLVMKGRWVLEATSDILSAMRRMSFLGLMLFWSLIPKAHAETAQADDPTEGSAPIEEPRRLEFGADLTVATTYIYRGEIQYASPMTPSLQSSIWLDFAYLVPGSLDITIWSAFAMAGRDRARRLGTANEVDFSVIYENPVASEWLTLRGGLLYYIYPGAEQVDGEKELLLGLNMENLPVILGVDLYMEVHPGLGLYIEPILGWDRTFGTSFTVGMNFILGASIYRDLGASLDHATLTALVSHEAGLLTFSLSFSYTLRIAPSGLDFLERSLLRGALSLSINR